MASITPTPSVEAKRSEPARPRRRGWLKWTGRALTVIVGFLVLVGVSGAVYQAVASATDRRNHPAPGMLVDVGGHQLHLWCAGSGSPTVVLESGLGGFSFDWSFIREGIPESTRVCAYDRAGYGWSDPADAPLASDEVAQDLHDLLEGGGEAGPYVLVGHSAGGLHVRTFAGLFPDDVAGMILVDSAHENQRLRLSLLEAVEDQQLGKLKTCGLLSPIGLLRIIKAHDTGLPEDAPIAAEARAAWLSHLYETGFCGNTVREYEAFRLDTQQPQPPATLGDIPLVVLTRGTALSWEELPSSEGVTQEMMDEVNQGWLELQEELAALSTNSTHHVVADSGHYIHWDRPEVVLDVINEMVASLRS